MDVCSIHNLLKPCSVCADGELSRLRARVTDQDAKAAHDVAELHRMESEIAALQAIEDAARLVLFDYRVSEEWESEAMERLAVLLDARPTPETREALGAGEVDGG